MDTTKTVMKHPQCNPKGYLLLLSRALHKLTLEGPSGPFEASRRHTEVFLRLLAAIYS